MKAGKFIYQCFGVCYNKNDHNKIESGDLICGHEEYIARIIFKNGIYKHMGQSFEDFFVNVMCKADPDFEPVKAYGRIGDQKNDGFNRKAGIYYQVFAPEDITKSTTITEGVKKLENDFAGLYAHWNAICPIKKFCFVINDKYAGVPAPFIKKVMELEQSPLYQDVNISIFSAKDLEMVFEQLRDNQKYDVVGYFPSEDMSVIAYDALQETVVHLLGIELPQDFTDNLVVPDFDEKITFNGLTEIVSSRLKTGSYQDGILLEYFNNSPGK